jgi:hypothetical protein
MRVLPIVLVLALAGCAQQQTSSNDFKGSEKAVAEAVEDLQANAQGRKPGVICSDDLSRELVAKLKTSGNDCTAEMEKITGDADDFQLDVTDVTITGNTATAKVTTRRGGDEDASTTYSLIREDGEWRLNDFGAS